MRKMALWMAVFALVAGFACAGERVKIRVAFHPGLNGSMIPGSDRLPGNDFFAKHGLEVEWIKFTSGPPEVAAMVSGNIQLGFIGHGAHTLAAEEKINIVMLDSFTNNERIYVRKASGIDSVAGLKGKTVATQLGTSGEVVLNLALKRIGLTKEDVKLVNMDMGGAVAAFIANQVDAIACWGPHAVNVQEKVGMDNMLILASTAEFTDETVFASSWVGTPKYIDANRDTVVKFLMGLYDNYEYRAKNYDAVIKSAAEFNDRTFDDFNKTRDNFNFFVPAEIKKMLADGEVYEAYQKQLDYFIVDGKVKGGDVRKYVRTDLMKEALEKGGW